jgi:proliferating cell nuclear antigen
MVIVLFKATFTAVSKFKYIAQTLAKITDEAPFYATPEELEAKILSPDKTTLTILKIPSIAFEDYSVDEEEFFVVSSDELNKVLRRGTRDDILEFNLDKENGRLKIIFRNKKTGMERTFYLELKPRAKEELPEPKLELGVSIKLLPDDYKQIIRDVKVVGEEAVFHYKDGKFHVYSMSQQKEYRGEFRSEEQHV